MSPQEIAYLYEKATKRWWLSVLYMTINAFHDHKITQFHLLTFHHCYGLRWVSQTIYYLVLRRTVTVTITDAGTDMILAP